MASTELSESTGIEDTMVWSPVATVELKVAPGDRVHIQNSRNDFRKLGDPCGSFEIQQRDELHPEV